MDACPHPNCFPDDNAQCTLGHMKLEQCPQWRGSLKAVGSTPSDVSQILLPWSGLAMGEFDLTYLSGRAKPITVGILGPESAGKTTILAAFYILLGRGALRPAKDSFSGSYTLAGWEAVASSLRWKPGLPPRFPAHTPSTAARAPGLLHLGFRSGDGFLRDFVFADAPGEWFQKWAINEQATDAEGARWIARRADVTLLIADRQALAGPKMGTARNEFQLMTQRAIAEARGRRLALVWTKGDVDVAPSMEQKIRDTVAARAPGIPEFTVSVMPRAGTNSTEEFEQLFNWILSTRRPAAVLPMTQVLGYDPLFRFGRR